MRSVKALAWCGGMAGIWRLVLQASGRGAFCARAVRGRYKRRGAYAALASGAYICKAYNYFRYYSQLFNLLLLAFK
jgi:hypothetical protein